MIYNFNAGPVHLDKQITENVSKAIQNYKGSGLSILELSHRSDEIVEVIEETKKRLYELLELKDEHHIIFMPGGASFQFYALAYNFLTDNDVAHYIDTGRWSNNAIVEAKRFGHVNIASSSAESSYNFIPSTHSIQDGKYLHFTSNNTIYGTSFKTLPDVNVPLVADMSSDILGRKFPYNEIDLIYAGAQKNLGTAGVGVVIIKDSFLKETKKNLAPMLSYKTMVDKNSLFNTPPVLPIYVLLETLRWIDKRGGIDNIYANNIQKSDVLYQVIEESKVFYCPVKNANDRSIMNVCFRCYDEKLEDRFLKYTLNKNIIGIKGHRTAGGFRASLYNCISIEQVNYLCQVIKDFEKTI